MATDKNNLFSGLFDLNGDGTTDLGEQLLAFAAFQACAEEDSGKKTVEITVERRKEERISVSFSEDGDDLEGLTPEELREELEKAEDALLALEDEEPGDGDEEAHAEWEERCEELEDRIDALEDRLDEPEE